MHCRNCGKEVNEHAVGCPACGVPPRIERKFCHHCGTPTQANQAMCVKCGGSLGNQGGEETIIEVIWEVRLRKFWQTQSWNIFITNERVIFQRVAGGGGAVLCFFFPLLTRLFRTTQRKSPDGISIDEILSKGFETLIIDATNASLLAVKRNNITVTSAKGQTRKFAMSGKKMRRFHEVYSLCACSK